METLVKMLETEKQLENERTKLAELRRHHYKLAGELEGWDEEVSINYVIAVLWHYEYKGKRSNGL